MLMFIKLCYLMIIFLEWWHLSSAFRLFLFRVTVCTLLDLSLHDIVCNVNPRGLEASVLFTFPPLFSLLLFIFAPLEGRGSSHPWLKTRSGSTHSTHCESQMSLLVKNLNLFWDFTGMCPSTKVNLKQWCAHAPLSLVAQQCLVPFTLCVFAFVFECVPRC